MGLQGEGEKSSSKGGMVLCVFLFYGMPKRDYLLVKNQSVQPTS